VPSFSSSFRFLYSFVFIHFFPLLYLGFKKLGKVQKIMAVLSHQSFYKPRMEVLENILSL
jgi:uncharacterized membrane-anchored protein YitT (DUF2179 family)